MEGAKGNALDWAMALLQAPGERHELRRRALPEGMDALLAVASGGVPAALAEAVEVTGQPEGVVREAARFYVREVLFHPQADAYRVLGVERDADIETIKSHFRLLQHWLHPDRQESEDDAVFAARVNTAWSRLRNEERRGAYDNTLSEPAPFTDVPAEPGAFDRGAWAPRPMPGETAMPATSGWRQRMPVFALIGVCVVLLVMVVVDADRRPDGAWVEDDGRVADADAKPEGNEVPALVLPKAAARAPSNPANGKQRSAKPSSVVATVAQPRQPESPLPTLPRAQARTEAALVERSPVVPTEPRSAPRPTSVQDSPAAIMHVEPPRPVAAPLARAPAPVRTPPPQVLSAPAAPPQVQALRSPPAPSSSPAAPAPEIPSAQRIQQARVAGTQLLRYMENARRAAPPIWNSPAIQSIAAELRGELQGSGRVRMDDPEWRIGINSAVLVARYRMHGIEGAAGQLSADLVWREGQWLVTGLSRQAP